jgi:fatty acid desaturase
VVTVAMRVRSLVREPEGLLPNSLAVSYAVLGHLLGLTLLVTATGVWRVLAVLLTAHTMVIAAYLIHETAHMNILRDTRHNRWLGELMGWLCGAAYASFERIRHMHLRHHRDRADVTRFNYKLLLKRVPMWARRAVYVMEWAYLPAVELIMHYQLLARPFIDPREAGRRTRVVVVLASRALLFAVLWWSSPPALALYAVAYLLFLTVMNFADAFHHTFDQYFVDDDGQPIPMDGKDRRYEQAHTYSNLVSARWPRLNLLTLNFGFHNAHHERMSVPWYRLPAAHRELFGAGDRQVLPFRELLVTFHRNRLKRVLDDDYGRVGDGRGRADGFIGAHGVSFLTVV